MKKFKKLNTPKLEMSLDDKIESLERKFKNLQEYVFERFEQRPDMGDI